jgi:HD-like signal output (HDOD) protein
VALAASLTRMFRGGAIGDTFSARELWRHSVAVATGARLLAARSGSVDGSEAFLAGLMHDVGIIIEMQACRDGFVQVITGVAADPALDFREAETAAIGADHEEFGRSLCRAWRFPERLQFVSGFHHRPLDVPGEHQRLVAVVHIADHLAARSALGYGRMVHAGAINEAVMALAALTDADLEAVVRVLPEEVDAVFSVLSGEEVAA